MHPEAVKAAIRIKYGSVRAFAAKRGLTRDSVVDLLRGKSTTAKEAVAEVLGVDPVHLEITTKSANAELVSTDDLPAHPLSEVAK